MRLSRPAHPTRARALSRLALTLQLLAAAACSSQEPGSEPAGPRFIPTLGGQSGQEGACVRLEGDVPPLDVTFGALFGRHDTKLRWNDHDESSPLADGRGGRVRASFEISARGEREVDGECGASTVLDIDVRMQVPESDLDVTFEAVASATGAGKAVAIETKFDRAFRSALTGRAREFVDGLLGVPPPTAAEAYYFNMWQFRGIVSGRLSGGHEGRPGCGLAIWPEEYCGDDLAVAMPVADALGDLDILRVLEALGDIGEQALEWTDGRSARVRFEVEPEPDTRVVCTGPYSPRYGDDAAGGNEIELPARIRAISDDGALDVTLAGKIVATVLTKQGFTGRVRLEAHAVMSADMTEAGRVPVAAPGDGRALLVSLLAERGVSGDDIQVSLMSAPSDSAGSYTYGDSLGSVSNYVRRALTCSGAPQQAGEIETLLQGNWSDR